MSCFILNLAMIIEDYRSKKITESELQENLAELREAKMAYLKSQGK